MATNETKKKYKYVSTDQISEIRKEAYLAGQQSVKPWLRYEHFGDHEAYASTIIEQTVDQYLELFDKDKE